MERRDLLRSILALVGLAATARAQAPDAASAPPTPEPPAPPSAPTPPGALPTRPFGKTGETLPILGLGGFHLGLSEEEPAARALVDVALEEGIRFFDNAESYQDGKAESLMGAALVGRREKVFLMTKTHEPETRSAEGAKRHLEGSLKRLRTDRLDLWQLHSIKSPADVDRAFRKGGAMEYIRSMKEQGVIRFAGVTGHTSPAANLRALQWFDRGMTFDAMQMPINPIDWHQSSFQRALLPELEKRGIAAIAMKTSAGGALVKRGITTLEENLGYVWSSHVSLAVVGMETVEHVRHNAKLAREHVHWNRSRREALRERIAPKADLDLEWYKPKA